MNLKQAQERVWKNKVAKGFNLDNVEADFCLLYGEVTEAFDACTRGKGDLALELADVVIYAMGIAERHSIDLEEAIERKMGINEKRFYYEVDGEVLKTEGGSSR